MIPAAFVHEWHSHVPWPTLWQVEQDLVIRRALCDLFDHPVIQANIAFRGGTAIHNLLFEQPLRYSEDIDLVQVEPGRIGPILDAIRDALHWLGRPRFNRAIHSAQFFFRFDSDFNGGARSRLKVEINTREHGSRFGIQLYPFVVENSWHRGRATIRSYRPEELFGTKLRALLQRRKSRDMFDMYWGLRDLHLDRDAIVEGLDFYSSFSDDRISRANAEERMLGKLDADTSDIQWMLPPGVVADEEAARLAFEMIWNELIVRLPGDPWRNTEIELEELRRERFPDLLRCRG